MRNGLPATSDSHPPAASVLREGATAEDPGFTQETREHARAHDCGSSPNVPMCACVCPRKNENSRGGGHSLISCWLVSKARLARLVDTLNTQCSCFKKRFTNNLRKRTGLMLTHMLCVQDVLCDPGLFTTSKRTVCRFFKQRPQFRVLHISL